MSVVLLGFGSVLVCLCGRGTELYKNNVLRRLQICFQEKSTPELEERPEPSYCESVGGCQRARLVDNCFLGRYAEHSCEVSFRHSRCVRQGGVEAPTLWNKIKLFLVVLLNEHRQSKH